MSTSSSFYTDGEAYEEAVVESPPVLSSITPSQAPSSFYPDGGAYNESDPAIAQEFASQAAASPFDLRELRARVKSVLRRMQARAPAAVAVDAAGSQRMPVGACTLDILSRQLFGMDGHEIPLTAMEFDLLKVFVERPNQVLNRDQLLTLTRNREWEPFDRSIDIRIARVRRKIEADPERPQAIRTVRGTGYMFVPPRDVL